MDKELRQAVADCVLEVLSYRLRFVGSTDSNGATEFESLYSRVDRDAFNTLNDGPVHVVDIVGGEQAADTFTYDTLRNALTELYGPSAGPDRPEWCSL